MAAPPVLPEMDPLPGAEREPAMAERDRELGRREGGAHVGRHVVGAFVAMAKERVAVGNEAREEAVEIGANVRVGVLLDHKAGRGVADEQREQSGAETARTG